MQHVKTPTITPPKIVDDDVPVPDDKTMVHNDDLHNVQPGVTNTTGNATGIAVASGGGNGTGVAPSAGNNAQVPFTWVSQMPEFNGDMNSFISKHLRYPEAARDANIEGRIIVVFIVNEDGSLSDIKVAHGIGGGCDEEAIRMVSSMPRWKPGKQNGSPVKVMLRLPILFVLH